MRKVLTLAVALVATTLSGCSSGGGCSNDCAPQTKQCKTWTPDCCNNWDFYVPCDLIEGRAYRTADTCAQVPTCSPCK